ncbi:MAG: glycosyltransferase [Bacteroidia bacterium]
MTKAIATIDVVIPVFNGQDYIAQAIRSVLTQTVLPVNLFIVNDGSTDHTQTILEQIKNENATPVTILIIQQANKGLSAARNAGIASSASEFIALLDADDRWLPLKLEKQLGVFQQTQLKNTGLVYCNYKVVDEDGKDNSLAEVIAVKPDIRGGVFNAITRGNFISGSGSGVLVKRKCFEKVGMFDEHLKAYEDWDMWLRIAQEFEFDYTEETLLEIRQHSKSMQKDERHMNKNALLFYKKWLPHVQDKETLRQWAFRIARPVYVNGFSDEYLAVIKSVFTAIELNKLFSRTFGSLGLYVFLKRMGTNKYRLDDE